MIRLLVAALGFDSMGNISPAVSKLGQKLKEGSDKGLYKTRKDIIKEVEKFSESNFAKGDNDASHLPEYAEYV